MAEQVGDVGQADAGHPQVSAETVSQGVHRGGLDRRAPTHVLQLLKDVAVALAGAVRECPLIAGSIRVLFEEKLLTVGEIGITRSSVFGCQPTSGLAWINSIPSSKFNSFHVGCSISPFRIPVSRIVENNRRSSSRQPAKNLRRSFGNL